MAVQCTGAGAKGFQRCCLRLVQYLYIITCNSVILEYNKVFEIHPISREILEALAR